MTAQSLSSAIAEIALPDVDGNRIQLGSLWAKQLGVVVFLRHWG